MKVLHVTAIFAFALAVCSTGVLADDYNPPAWCGDDFTTFQIWEFSDNSNPADPDAVVNPYGDPYAAMSGSLWLPMDLGHQGVWRVGSGSMDFYIPNTDNEDPDSYKEIWLQLTFLAEDSEPPLFFTDPMWTIEPETVDFSLIGDGYIHATFLILLEPNPTEETIQIFPRHCTLYIDEVVVDTRCVPAPATLTLLLLSAGMVLRRRR